MNLLCLLASRRRFFHNRQMSEATRILAELFCGSPQAADELFPVVYDELRLLATRKMNRERSNHTL